MIGGIDIMVKPTIEWVHQGITGNCGASPSRSYVEISRTNLRKEFRAGTYQLQKDDARIQHFLQASVLQLRKFQNRRHGPDL